LKNMKHNKSFCVC